MPETVVMHLPCSCLSKDEGLDKDEGYEKYERYENTCPICLSSTEEVADVTKCLSTIKKQKCSEEVCSKQPKTFFWPCQHNFFCQSCAETHFECAKTGRERCLCGELIEGIYTMDTTDLDNETTPQQSAF